jgi:putative membrane protein
MRESPCGGAFARPRAVWTHPSYAIDARGTIRRPSRDHAAVRVVTPPRRARVLAAAFAFADHACMNTPRRSPFRVWLLIGFLAILAASFIQPTDLSDMLLEHIPTLALLGFLVWVDRGSPLSNASYTLLFVFLLLHVVGAHYLYMNVPYDTWSRALLGTGISDLIGTERNHYDRLVHFTFGLLLVKPMCELVERFLGLRRVGGLVVSIAFLAVLSKSYELIEWGIAAFMDPESADAYNGQQGDVFDAHKDMALAFIGSILGGIIVLPAGGPGRQRALVAGRDAPRGADR